MSCCFCLAIYDCRHVQSVAISRSSFIPSLTVWTNYYNVLISLHKSVLSQQQAPLRPACLACNFNEGDKLDMCNWQPALWPQTASHCAFDGRSRRTEEREKARRDFHDHVSKYDLLSAFTFCLAL